VDKLPELVEELGKEASIVSKKVQEKTKQVHELAAAIGSISIESKEKSPTLADLSGIEKTPLTLSSELAKTAKKIGELTAGLNELGIK
jgi:predicted RNase H-like nuclease (RuvC/YqgF family)